MSLFVRNSTPSKSLVEDCLAYPISATKTKSLALPTEFSNEDADASRVDTDVDRPVS